MLLTVSFQSSILDVSQYYEYVSDMYMNLQLQSFC